MKRRHNVKGSYTIEAALLMGVILPFLVVVIYMGFFLHDRGFLQGAAHEAAVYASLHIDDARDERSAAQSLVAGRTLGVRSADVNMDVGEREVNVNYSGNFQAPGMFGGLLGHTVHSGVTLSLERPSRRIQKIRGVAKIIQSVRRIRE